VVTAPRGRWVSGNDFSALAGQEADPPPSVSVIVLHHEQPRQLERTLHALAHQSYRGAMEVIVVDDGSEPPPRVPTGVHLVRQARHGARRAAARNRGVQASRGEVLGFLDADTTPESGYVAELTRLPALIPEAVTVGRRRHARLDAVALEADLAEAGPANELPSPNWLAAGYRTSQDLLRAGPADFRFIISAVMAASRWFFDEVGGFDESFDTYGGEDWEWAHRAWLNGAVFAHVPGAVAWHDGPDWAARGTGGTDQGDGITEARRTGARAQKNAEAMRLAQLITAAGHRPHGLLALRAETLIQFSGTLQPAAAFVCVDSLLAALPRAAVRVPAELRTYLGDDPRLVEGTGQLSGQADRAALHVTVHAALSTVPAELAALCGAMLEGDEGICHLCDDVGELMTLESSRHRARVARWGPAAGLGTSEERCDWLMRLPDPPDVEAYLGGWLR
jgi:GT2 family glycosyltransferase